MTRTALWLLVLLPAVVGLALPLAARGRRFAAAVSVATAALTVLLAVVVAVGRPAVAVPFLAGTDFALEVDGLSAVVVPTVAVVSLLVLLFASDDVEEAAPRFHGLMLLFVAAALLTCTAATLPTLLLAWEVMGATSYLLIGFWWREEHRVSAGLTAFLTTRAADLGLYAAAGAALAGGAGLALADLPEGTGGWRDVVAAGVLVAALGKAAQLPFSFWLSGAMAGPSPVSALLHSAAMVALGGYLLLRTAPLLAATGWADVAAAWVGGLTALALGAVALAQRDLKQLLAASTAAQLGFVVMGAGLAAVDGGTAHLLAHGATKAALFLAAGAWLTALGTDGLADLTGAARRWPPLGWAATVAALSLAGVAPLALWATKDAVLAAALEESAPLYVVGLAAAALSTAYAGKVLLVLWDLHPADPGRAGLPADERRDDDRVLTWRQQAPVVALAGGAAVLGLLALPPLAGPFARLVGASSPHPAWWELAGSAVLALAVLGLVHRYRPPEPRWAAGWLGLEVAVRAVVVRPTLRLADALARFDDRVLDRLVDSTATTGLRAARRAATFDDQGVDAVVTRLATGVRRLGGLARRPQTGLLHQYYVQAVAVLAVAVLLLLVVR